MRDGDEAACPLGRNRHRYTPCRALEVTGRWAHLRTLSSRKTHLGYSICDDVEIEVLQSTEGEQDRHGWINPPGFFRTIGHWRFTRAAEALAAFLDYNWTGEGDPPGLWVEKHWWGPGNKMCQAKGPGADLPPDRLPMSWMDVDSVAQLLGVERRRVYQLLAQQAIPSAKRSGPKGKGFYSFDGAAVRAWHLAKGGSQNPPKKRRKKPR